MGTQQKIRATYSGRVQGVGFRASVLEIALQFPLVGEVCNISNGTVELEAVGETQPLLAFLQTIDHRMSRNIEYCQVEWLDANPSEFSAFSIAPDKWGGD